MIHVFFVPGMHGSMIEHVLKAYTQERRNDRVDILPDGSMHLAPKDFHFGQLNILSDNLIPENEDTITTPIYPMANAGLSDIIKLFAQRAWTWPRDRKILIYAADQSWAEINMLFQYHKIVRGSVNRGFDIFVGSGIENVRRWNPKYSHWNQMQPWEFREWMSLLYPGWVQEWISSPANVTDEWLTVANKDIINDIVGTMNRIIDFCGFTPRDDLEAFLTDYRARQQYVVDEHFWAHRAVQHALSGVDTTWPALSPVGEAIVQHHLRSQGWEIKCDGLDIFPTNSVQLKKLLYQPKEGLHTT